MSEIFLGNSTGWSQKPRRIALTRHALTVAGSGAGKGSCQIIPNLRGAHAWRGSAVVVDPKGEAAQETALWRRDELGQEVAVLDPFHYANIPDELRRALNPLDMVETFEDVTALGNGLILRADNEREPHWNDCAQTLLQGAVALVKSSPNIPDEHRNLVTVAAFLDELKDQSPVPGAAPAATVASMAKAALRSCPAFGGLGRKAAAMLTETRESEAFFTTLNRQTLWLASDTIREFLAAPSSVDLRQLKRGRMTVYLVLPPDLLTDYARFLRVFTQQALSVMWEKMPDGAEMGTRCLFVLDEFPALGRMDKLKVEALPLGRSYGLHVWPFLQYWQQLIDTYGESGAEAFLASCDALCAYGLDDEETPELLSRLMGRVSVDELEGTLSASLHGRPRSYIKKHIEQPENGKANPLLGTLRDRETLLETARDHEIRTWEDKQSLTRSLITARHNLPRMPADEITRQTAVDPATKIARAMLVRLRGNEWLTLTPAPYFGKIAAAKRELIDYAEEAAGLIFPALLALSIPVGIVTASNGLPAGLSAAYWCALGLLTVTGSVGVAALLGFLLHKAVPVASASDMALALAGCGFVVGLLGFVIGFSGGGEALATFVRVSLLTVAPLLLVAAVGLLMDRTFKRARKRRLDHIVKRASSASM